MRGAGPVGDFGLCRAAVGTLVDRPVRALAAGRRAVQNCRVSLPCVTVTCKLIRQKARPLCCLPAWLVKLPLAGSDGRMSRYLLRHRRLYTYSPSRAAHRWTVGQRSCVERSMAARAGPDPMFNAAAKPASDGASPRPPVLLLRLPSLCSKSLLAAREAPTRVQIRAVCDCDLDAPLSAHTWTPIPSCLCLRSSRSFLLNYVNAVPTLIYPQCTRIRCALTAKDLYCKLLIAQAVFFSPDPNICVLKV